MESRGFIGRQQQVWAQVLYQGSVMGTSSYSHCLNVNVKSCHTNLEISECSTKSSVALSLIASRKLFLKLWLDILTILGGFWILLCSKNISWKTLLQRFRSWALYFENFCKITEISWVLAILQDFNHIFLQIIFGTCRQHLSMSHMLCYWQLHHKPMD